MVLYDSSLPFVWGLWGLQSKLVKIIIRQFDRFHSDSEPWNATRSGACDEHACGGLYDRTNDMVFI